MSDNKAAPVVLCFGEMLWDSLPQGLFPGGAPMNVAFHLHRLGLRAAPVSAVGRDTLGDELMRRVSGWGLVRDFILVRDDKSTGLVRVKIDDGSPSYEIVEDVAWDWIELPQDAKPPASKAGALIFGSLAQRGEHNRKLLNHLRKLCGNALKVFDVNLRPPFDSPDLVWSLVENVDLIKLNDEEARKLLQHDYPKSKLEAAARALSQKAKCPRVCITAGADGAGLLVDSDWTWVESKPVKVKDTVGAGDSFLAALVKGMVDGRRTAEEMLAFACRLAGFVASSEGATPDYTVSQTGEIRAGKNSHR